MLIKILNIPSFYSNYYLLGFSNEFKIKYQLDSRFVKYNNKPVLVFEVENLIGIIDNDDPSDIVQELYGICNIYFVTNKLKVAPSYQQEKVRPLFPHYPVNILSLYFGLFGINLFRHIKVKELIRQVYIQLRRPVYENKRVKQITNKFVFFSSNIWKKEPYANTIRAEFIRFCKKDSRIKFEGGFVSRSDGNNLGFDDLTNNVVYSPKTFSRLSASSFVVLNNPAVCGAVSWRLAEYLNQGLFVLSFPFEVHLPVAFVHQENIHFIEVAKEYQEVFDKLLNDTEYHDKIASSGKQYFDKWCTPSAQADYIVRELSNAK